MNFSKKSGKKKAAAAAVVCFVAAIAIAGTYTFNDYKKSQSETELAKAEETNVTEEKYTVETGELTQNVVANEAETSEDDATDEIEGASDTADAEPDNPDDSAASISPVEDVSVSNAVSVNFTSESKMLWPVSGALLMDYSMEKTVYFKTLDQYKYNPAMIIAAAENDQVMAGASGIVKSIDNVAETGTTVNIDLGNGYEAFYGQLTNVQVQTGDYVEATTTLGYITTPTKYYSSEGGNLYFEMRKDGQPIDPKEYLTDYVE